MCERDRLAGRTRGQERLYLSQHQLRAARHGGVAERRAVFSGRCDEGIDVGHAQSFEPDELSEQARHIEDGQHDVTMSRAPNVRRRHSLLATCRPHYRRPGDGGSAPLECRWGRLAEPGFLVALTNGGPPDRTGFAGGGRESGRVSSGSPGCFVGCSQAPWTRYGASGPVDRSAYAFRILRRSSSRPTAVSAPPWEGLDASAARAWARRMLSAVVTIRA